MTQNTKYILIGLSGLVLGGLLTMLVVHWQNESEQFEDYVEARDAAPDQDEFDRNFAAMVAWLENYKRENPGATDEDASRAFEAAWRGQ